eukprot:s1704_g2.t1
MRARGQCQLPEDLCCCLGYAPLHCAAQAGSTDCVQLLLDAEADVSTQSGHLHFNIAANFEGREREATTADGLTPLHVAIACGHLEVARLLVQHGADVNQLARKPMKAAMGIAVWARQSRGMKEFLRRVAIEEAWRRAEIPGPLVRAEAFLAAQGASVRLLQNDRLKALHRRVLAKEKDLDKDTNNIPDECPCGTAAPV